MTPTYTLRDTETGMAVVETDDEAEVCRHVAQALADDEYPNWLALTVTTPHGPVTISGATLFAWARNAEG